ncbi:hypothetical protein GCM10010885_00670 [Alicyclobacillus cellulosilyticus]|uniref:Uncharacterized protein n=1 Tax=Alicyclobacillus cellulosilyticus TaxID=1003997 RepID=A0A917K0M6_9BACL|nr:hypothetical protein [Alicyclobacillus cellulosilyticus]GGI94997.1 hypothetical protein GCM10010885_00670 [Alicyclobacillus cellulosilyticus]
MNRFQRAVVALSAALAAVAVLTFTSNVWPAHATGTSTAHPSLHTAARFTVIPVARDWTDGLDLTKINGTRNAAYQLTYLQAIPDGQGLVIRGKLHAFEATGAVQGTTVQGKPVPLNYPGVRSVLAIHAAQGAPAWGDFRLQVHYPPSLRGHELQLTFFVSSAKDGSRQNVLKIRIPIPGRPPVTHRASVTMDR